MGDGSAHRNTRSIASPPREMRPPYPCRGDRRRLPTGIFPLAPLQTSILHDMSKEISDIAPVLAAPEGRPENSTRISPSPSQITSPRRIGLKEGGHQNDSLSKGRRGITCGGWEGKLPCGDKGHPDKKMII